MVRAAPIRRYLPPYENCTTRLPAHLNSSRRVAREADATLPRSRLRCARWTSTICHRSRPRFAKHSRPRNGKIGSAVENRNGWATRARKIGKDGRIEKYQCRFVTRGFRQIKGIHYDESSSPTPSQAGMRMVFSIAAVKEWKLRQLDVDMAYLEADVK